MRELPKLNAVAVDDEPEPKPERDRDIVPYLIVITTILCRLILDCCNVPAPLITSWQSWWITITVMALTGNFVLPYLEKQYGNEKITEKIRQYYICLCVSLWELLAVDNYFPLFTLTILTVLTTSHIFQFLLARKK
jgi:hypothetical protein